MRTFFRARVNPDGERGATIVIVALALIAMFGMVVLVVDVGGLLWKRRELVNGSDAAALSAAATCSLPSSVDPRTAEVAADELARENVTGLDPTTATNATVPAGLCHATSAGWVKVQYSQNQHLFFAPVLGFPNQNGVTTKAYAIWGPPGSANPVPIVIYTSAFQDPNCNVSANLPQGTICHLWFDNDKFTNSAFGFLNLNVNDPQKGWDVAPDAQCPNIGSSTRADWINQTGSVADLPVHYTTTNPAPTYVCRVSGLSNNDWTNLRSRAGDVVTFPMDDCTQNVDSGGNVVGCPGNADKYDIIGFIDFKLDFVLDQANGPNGWLGTPTTTCQQNNFSVTHNQTYSLLGLGSGGCPAVTDASAVIDATTLTIDGKKPTDTGAQYTYNAAAKSFTWTGPTSPPNIKIQFDWSIPGRCGTPPSDSSAVCIVVETVAVRLGGNNPCPTCSPLSNIRAVKLCDPSIAGSCNGVAVQP